MHMKCLDCNYGCGTPHTLLFHYKIEHKDKVSKCACGNQTISGNCVEEISSKLRGTASKCSSQSVLVPNSSSSSIFSSSSNPKSDSNLRSSWGTKGEAPFSNSSPKSNSIPNSIPYPNPKNLRNSWGTKEEALFTDSHIETKFDITNKMF